MKAKMSNYGDNIRKIARYQYLLDKILAGQSALDALTKASIKGTRAIAYLDKSSLASSAVNGATGTLKPNSSVGANNAASGARNGAQSALDAADPSNGASESGNTGDLASDDNTEKDGYYDIESLLNNTKDDYDKSPPTGAAREVINGLTGMRTSAGRAAHALFRDGAYVGPNNVDNANEAPVDSTFTSGLVWALISGGTKYFAQSFSELMGVRSALDGSEARNVSPGPPYNSPATVGSNIIFTFAPAYSSGTGYGFVAYSPGASINIGTYGQEDCGLNVGSAAVCALPNPPTGSWPDLGLTQLAWVSTVVGPVNPLANAGRFVPNPFDVSVPVEYTNGSSILDLETTSGLDVRIGPLRDGGWYVYYRDVSNNNLPVGSASANSVYIVHANRETGGFISPNQLSTMLPI